VSRPRSQAASRGGTGLTSGMRPEHHAVPATMGGMYPDPFGGEPKPDLTNLDMLIQEVELQAALLIEVATGGRSRDVMQWEYHDRRRRLVPALTSRGLQYPFPWQDLGHWYGYWSANLRTYEERRAKINGLIALTLAALQRLRSGLAVSDPGGGPLTWSGLDARLEELSAELVGAASRDDLQDVGRRAREILIDCAQLLADPSLMPVGQDPPKAGDAKAWFELFLAARAYGSHRDALRRFIRAAWELAQTVTHSNIDRVEAFAAAQATVLVVRTLQALAAAAVPPPAPSPW
jgi:hypothetical protein